MEVRERNAQVLSKYSFEDALDSTHFGKYNWLMLSTCCCLILAMYTDIFGFSVVLPCVACDLRLSTEQQGLLSAVPLIGVMLSSYAWGLCADTLGRRTTLLLAMPVGAIFNLAVSIAPGFVSLAVLKFLSGAFTASANAAAFVLQGESVPHHHRSRFMFLMASATMIVQFIIAAIALPVFKLKFSINIPWLSLTYRPWRLLLQIISLPGILGVIGLLFLKESPKFLLSRGQEHASLDVLKVMYQWNTGRKPDLYPVKSLDLEESPRPDEPSSFLRRVWLQTAPLFKSPLRRNSLTLYYLLLCAYMTSTGFTMWVPTMTNAYFNGGDNNGTFCEVVRHAAKNIHTIDSTPTETDCDAVVQPLTLYAVMVYSGVSCTLNILLTFIVEPLGKRRTTCLVFGVSFLCGLLLLVVRIPLLSIALFYIFLYVALILGNVNTYLVELNPTHLRGMATCLSVVVARGFGFFSVQVIGELLEDFCTPMLGLYAALVMSGLSVAIFFLPPDIKKIEELPKNIQTENKNDKT